MKVKISRFFGVFYISFIGVLIILPEPVFAQNKMQENSEFTVNQSKQAKKALRNQNAVKKEAFSGEYTLGKDDIIEINVRRHPEFSGRFPLGVDGKIQYPFIGDIDLSGLTKTQASAKITSTLSVYVESPEVGVTILEYNSKVVYVVGMVARPGRYSMRAEFMPVREAVMDAGLPRENVASLRRAVIIRPLEGDKPIVKKINLLNLLYNGELKINYDLKSGDIVYLPSTALYKVSTVLSQIVAPFYQSSSAYNTYEEDVLYRDQPRRD
ncbi:MAG: polysaccharide export protein [Candidatus Omnitrophica bacterium]|nr:polysaccharide export protein [Candidatus Omnitrophota bacterium]